MDELFSKISSMLEDPQTAGKLKEIAASVAGNEVSASGNGASAEDGNLPKLSDIPESAETGKTGTADLSSIFPGMAADDRGVNLLRAIKPYMRESRAGKIDSAIRIMQMMKVIGTLK